MLSCRMPQFEDINKQKNNHVHELHKSTFSILCKLINKITAFQ